jgi:hypothetical protein
VWAAAVKKPSYLGLAAVPIFFGLQQISEGFVWLGADPYTGTIEARGASLVFLFFALAFWPFWFPLLTAVMEPQPTRKRIFIALSVLATFWFWVLYFPLLTDQVLWVPKVVHHSVQYEYEVPIHRLTGKPLLRLLYFLSVALPPILGTENWGRIPGLVLGASALVAVAFFDYAFISVWCFFAAGLSSYCVVLFYRLPAPVVAPAATISACLPAK